MHWILLLILSQGESSRAVWPLKMSSLSYLLILATLLAGGKSILFVYVLIYTEAAL